jgi:hypothetical protein
MSGSGTLIKSGNGTFTIAGAVSQSIQINGGTLSVTGAPTGGSVTNNTTLTIDGGQMLLSDTLTSTASTAILRLNSGSITAKQIVVAANNAPYASTFTWTAGTIHLTGVNGVNIARVTSNPESQTLLGSPDRPFKNLLTLDSAKTLIVDQTTTVGSGGTLNIGGGSLTTRALAVNSAGAFNLFSGTLHFTQAVTIDSNFLALTHLGTVGAGQNLIIDGVATINTPMTLAGGSMAVDNLVNPQNLSLQGGTLSVRLGNLNVHNTDFLTLTRGSVMNVGATLNVASGGEIDLIGATMNITGASANVGQINAINSTLNLRGGLSGSGQLNLINSTVNTSAGVVVGAAVGASGTNSLVGKMSGGTLNVSSGSFGFGPGSGTSAVDTLSMGSGARVNLNGNSMVIRTADLAVITEQIRAGLGGAGGIAGGGGDASLVLGSMSNGASGSPIYAAFEGVAGLSGGEVLLRSTIVGDLNLDGAVTISDFIDLSANFNVTSGATWQKGDVNYDGAITISDFIDLAAHFGQSLSGPVAVSREERAMVSEFGAAVGVPEPGVMMLFVAAMPVLLKRRRR